MRIMLLLVALTGCASIQTEFVRTHETRRAPQPGDRVEVFLASRPSRPFTEIGLVEVQGASDITSSELMAALRARAGSEGCNAVMFLGDNDRPWSTSSSSTSTSTSEDSTTKTTTDTTSASSGVQQGYRAVCIVYDAAPGA